MAERQVGHWKSCLVLSARFPLSTDVIVLLLNQPKNISLGPRKGGCVRLTEKTAVCILYLIKTYNRRQNVLRIYLFLPWSPPCNVVPMFELPIENNKHPNFELREQRRGVDSFVLWGYRLWALCLNYFVADCRYSHYQMSWNCYSFKFICQDFSEEDEWYNKSHE